MATEVLSAVEREAARVAAAFEIGELDQRGNLFFAKFSSSNWPNFRLGADGTLEWFSFRHNDVMLCSDGTYGFYSAPEDKDRERLARGLYRLGFEDEAILAQLPRLSWTEKMELRQEMPCEFWPQKWLEEVKE